MDKFPFRIQERWIYKKKDDLIIHTQSKVEWKHYLRVEENLDLK